MAKVIRLNKYQKKHWRRQRARTSSFLRTSLINMMIFAGIFIFAGLDKPSTSGVRLSVPAMAQSDKPGLIACDSPYVIDGDTMDCGGRRIRLAGIDTPEMPGHCNPGRQCTPGDPYAARSYLSDLTKGVVVCTPIEQDRYGRTVASCQTKGRDISCEMIRKGHAVHRYRALSCS